MTTETKTAQHETDPETVESDIVPDVTKEALCSLWIIYFSVFLDFMGFSVIQPILPFYAGKFGASSYALGALYSSYSAMAFLATFGMGRGADKLGRRPMILFSLFGTMAGSLLTGLAQNYGQLLACRFLTGAFGATAPVAQACITDLVPAAKRSKYMSAIGAVTGAAFVIGPGLGSGLSEWGIRVPFFASSALGALGFAFALCVLTESHPLILEKRSRKASNSPAQPNPNAVNDKDADSEAKDDGTRPGRTDKNKQAPSDKVPPQIWMS